MVETFPEHKVVKWVGHSSAVARKFYLQMKDEDFKHAAREAETPAKEAAQNAAQYGVETVCNDVKPEGKNTGFTGIYGGTALGTLLRMGDKGTELPPDCAGNVASLPAGGAKSGAVDAELGQIVTLWSHLPAAARTAIVALAHAAAAKG